MSMVPMRMQMYDPMPLRLGPAIKLPPPPLRMPEPPQHDWSCGMPSDGQARSTQGVTHSVLIDGVLATSPDGVDWTTNDVRFRNMRSPHLSRAELANTIRYAPAQCPGVQDPGWAELGLTPELLNPISGELVRHVSGLLGYARVENSELVNMIKYVPLSEQEPARVWASGCPVAPWLLGPAPWPPGKPI